MNKINVEIPPKEEREKKQTLKIWHIILALVLLSLLCHFVVHLCSRLDEPGPSIRTEITYDANGTPQVKDILGGEIGFQCPFCKKFLFPGEW